MSIKTGIYHGTRELPNKLRTTRVSRFVKFLKQLAAKLPARVQYELKRVFFGRQIANNKFVTDEPEFGALDKYVSRGDWVIDIGANIGHYTCQLSNIVGPNGRVIAFEPILTTFALLAANVQRLEYSNVTLINAAASDETTVTGMSMPIFASGLENFYRASISDERNETDLNILAMPVDNLNLQNKVGFIKIDAEGHEPSVVRGLHKLLERDKPRIVIETVTDEIHTYLIQLGYKDMRLADSPNTIYCIAI